MPLHAAYLEKTEGEKKCEAPAKRYYRNKKCEYKTLYIYLETSMGEILALKKLTSKKQVSNFTKPSPPQKNRFNYPVIAASALQDNRRETNATLLAMTFEVDYKHLPLISKK